MYWLTFNFFSWCWVLDTCTRSHTHTHFGKNFFYVNYDLCFNLENCRLRLSHTTKKGDIRQNEPEESKEAMNFQIVARSNIFLYARNRNVTTTNLNHWVTNGTDTNKHFQWNNLSIWKGKNPFLRLELTISRHSILSTLAPKFPHNVLFSFTFSFAHDFYFAFPQFHFKLPARFTGNKIIALLDSKLKGKKWRTKREIEKERESVAGGDLVMRRFSQFVVRAYKRQGYKLRGNGKKSLFSPVKQIQTNNCGIDDDDRAYGKWCKWIWKATANLLWFMGKKKRSKTVIRD